MMMDLEDLQSMPAVLCVGVLTTVVATLVAVHYGVITLMWPEQMRLYQRVKHAQHESLNILSASAFLALSCVAGPAPVFPGCMLFGWRCACVHEEGHRGAAVAC